VKIGGRILEDAELMDGFLSSIAKTLADRPLRLILVHGGGDQADRLAESLGIPQRKVKGRRITDSQTLDVAVMTFAGLLNKRLVARMQRLGINAIGMTGADAGIIPAVKRAPVAIDGEQVDFGWVGDPVESGIRSGTLASLLDLELTPVICALTHDGRGQLLNTNADTMAAMIASAMAASPMKDGAMAGGPMAAGELAVASAAHVNEVRLALLLDKPGILMDSDDPSTMIGGADPGTLSGWIDQGIIHSGMIPKAEMALAAVRKGVKDVVIGHPAGWEAMLRKEPGSGTWIHS
jgi:acetylglutamate kinase